MGLILVKFGWYSRFCRVRTCAMHVAAHLGTHARWYRERKQAMCMLLHCALHMCLSVLCKVLDPIGTCAFSFWLDKFVSVKPES
jgi:hypothetical protein